MGGGDGMRGLQHSTQVDSKVFAGQFIKALGAICGPTALPSPHRVYIIPQTSHSQINRIQSKNQSIRQRTMIVS